MGLLGPSFSSLSPYNINPESHQSSDSKIEVMADLETTVGILMAEHEAKRDLWWPSDLLGTEEDGDPHVAEVMLQEHAQGLSDPCRIAIALNLSARSDHQRIELPLEDRSVRIFPHPYRLRGAGW